jgi:uncharacterized membrane protein
MAWLQGKRSDDLTNCMHDMPTRHALLFFFFFLFLIFFRQTSFFLFSLSVTTLPMATARHTKRATDFWDLLFITLCLLLLFSFLFSDCVWSRDG